MEWEIFRSALPFIGVLIYMLVSTILTVLCAYRRNAVELHDRVREARQLRLEYFDQVSD